MAAAPPTSLELVSSRGLVDQVFDKLASAIMSGRYPAGSHLPSERALAESFAVNRQVVREASRRLAQMGLVQVLHGDGTRVLDFRATGGLELLALLIERQSAGGRSATFWLPILELRSALAPDVIRHCTRRASQALRNEILAVALKMRHAPDDAALLSLEQRFWSLVHDGADHVVYRFTFNTFRRCGESAGEQSAAFVVHEVKQAGYRVELAKAIAAGNAAKAEREIRKTMRATIEAFEAEQLKAARKAAAKKPKPKSKVLALPAKRAKPKGRSAK